MKDNITFTISKAGTEKYYEWAKSHKCKYRSEKGGPRYTGACGGADTWKITPTGLGCCVRVKCLCGAKLDLTDYELG